MKVAYLTPFLSIILIFLSMVYWNAIALLVPLVGLFVVQLSGLYFKSSCKGSKSYTAIYSLFTIWLIIVITTPFIPIIMSKPTEMAPNFQLISYDHKSFDLYYHKNSTFVLLISGAGLTSPPPNVLQTLNSREDIISVIIDNGASKRDALKDYAKKNRISTRILVDPSNIIHYEYKLTHQWNAVLISTDTWSIIYRGPLTTSNNRLNQTLTFLMSPPFKYFNRLTEIPLTGRPIQVQENEPVSYTKDVVPMLSKACLPCHNSRGIGTFPLDNYTTVLGWSAMIKEVLLTKRMPPFPADPYFGNIKNIPNFSSKDRLKLVQWINQGMQHRTQKDPLITRHRLASEVSIWGDLGTPDVIVTLPKYNVPKSGVYEVMDIELDLKITQNMSFRAFKYVSSDYQSLAHVGIYISNIKPDLLSDELTPSAYIGGVVPGSYDVSNIYPDNHFLSIKKGYKLKADIHYNPYGKPSTEQSQIGFYISKGPLNKKWKHFMFYPKTILIKPLDPNSRIVAKRKVEKTIKIYECHVHLHDRGRHSQLLVLTPDKKLKPLLSIPRYDPRWQLNYIFETPIVIEKGSTIIAKGAWDNSALNPNNPNPNAMVHDGDGDSEMFVITLIGVEL